MKKNLLLTGMMGVGKSTIGKKLAKKLKLKFIDIDQIIEKKEKRTIKEIFENKSEGYFRKIEKKISLEELKKSNAVIADNIWFGIDSFVIGLCLTPLVVPDVLAKYFGLPGHKTSCSPFFILSIYFLICS